MVQQVVLDKTDEKILNELLANAKTPLREMARRVGTSFVTVMNRIKKMERQGVIQKYTCRVDYERLGYDVHILVEMRIAKGRLIELERKIARSPNVLAVYDTTGDYDAVILARFKSTRAMDSFIKEIQTYDFVERTNTKLILNTIKEDALRL
ncbi:Lrp/AsnC family transcriptional regulator [Candidatus Woesearchaeota archaeon]|nr:Lrp/AsnC family transcriptional regulator [Candidatus Woesearchaeota archaeon]